MHRPCHQSTSQDRTQLLSACLPPEHRTGTPVAPPSAGPHVGGLATSPEGEHYCGGGLGAVPWCQLTGELKLTPARRRSARGRGFGVRGARSAVNHIIYNIIASLLAVEVISYCYLI